jgi:fructokinase
MRLGGIEAGGTKWTCAVSTDAGAISNVESFPTTTPSETLERAIGYFADHHDLAGIGVGTFGPVEVRPGSPKWGHITNTPKPGWAHTDVAPSLSAALGVPVGFDTDVNAAALGELRRGAAHGFRTFCYVTVGTGIGGGVIVDRRTVHGLLHPELGHIRIPHDWRRDPFEGACPFHGDCFEGLASGEALRQRWGRPAEELSRDDAWELEAHYLALGLLNIMFTLSPERIIVGGGVARRKGLLELVRARLGVLAAGYLDEITDRLDDYIVPPALGDLAGVIGAIELAREVVVAAALPRL